MSLLVHLEDAAALDPAAVGFKFAGLARARRAGFPVPAAVAVPTAAHLDFRRDGRPPAGLAEELRRAGGLLDPERGVSVRSSATLEDMADRSFAGQYETFLDVGPDDLLDRIERCWRSADSEVVRAYLRQAGQGGEGGREGGGDEGGGGAVGEKAPEEGPRMAVVVQRMVRAAFAGVAFSRDPLRPERDEVVIEAVAGLGERLVSGAVTPVRVFVPKDGEPRVEIAPAAGGTGAIDLPSDPALWRRVAELAREVEARLGEGRPQDVEWAVDGEGALWLLQARPITALDAAAGERAGAPGAPPAPPGTWTRAIAVDLWADRLSPFLADHMLATAPRWNFSATSRFVGLPVVEPALGVIDGYLYVNCASLEGALAIVPRRFRIDDLRAWFPPGYDLDRVPAPGAGKLVAFALRSALLGLVVPAGNPLFAAALARRGLRALGRELAAIERPPDGVREGATEAMARVERATELLARLQERNQWPYFYATVFTVALRWLVVDRAGGTHADFLGLLGGAGDSVTGSIERRFRELAALVAGDPALRERFLARPAAELAGSLPPAVRGPLDAFLAEFGFRARHRALYVPRWAEAPEEVLGMLQTLVRQGAGASAEQSAGATPAPGGLLVRLVRRFARRYLDLREDLRFFLDRVLFALRRSLLAVGAATGLGDDVFFLTAEELRRLIAGGLALDDARDARSRAAGRRSRLQAEARPPAFYLDGRPVEPLPEGDRLRGVGTSRGRAEGPARIVTDPTRAAIRRGDILVARNTDPGWTPVLSAVGGLVIEEGGLLNHCSIVARELRIPAVVGISRATSAIPEGAWVVVDGDLGLVTIAAAAGEGGAQDRKDGAR